MVIWQETAAFKENITKRKVAQLDLNHLLLIDHQKPEDLIGEDGILKPLNKAILGNRSPTGVIENRSPRASIKTSPASETGSTAQIAVVFLVEAERVT